jgi:transcriptional regulator GlxA family with amidase domain
METGNHIDEVFKEGNWQQRRLERIQKYIEDHLSEDLSAAVIAEKFDISASTLKHSFKKHMGQTCQQYVQEVRMKKAMEMIRQGKRIRAIMVATGYKNRSTFYDAFRRTFQHTPATFKYDDENAP